MSCNICDRNQTLYPSSLGMICTRCRNLANDIRKLGNLSITNDKELLIVLVKDYLERRVSIPNTKEEFMANRKLKKHLVELVKVPLK